MGVRARLDCPRKRATPKHTFSILSFYLSSDNLVTYYLLFKVLPDPINYKTQHKIQVIIFKTEAGVSWCQLLVNTGPVCL